MIDARKKFDLELPISPSEVGRLDKFLVSHFADRSRTYLQRLVNNRNILVDGHPVSPHHALRAGQNVQIRWPKKVAPPEPPKGPLPFEIFFEDDDVMVLNKPAGLVCHPTGGQHDRATLVDLLRPYVRRHEWPDDVRPGLVHRLDRDTSGVMIFAKTPEAHTGLSRQFAHRQVKKTYVALVKGVPSVKKGTLESAIGRHPEMRQRFAVVDAGRWSVTRFAVIEKFGHSSLLELNPLTGRTHQLRVQLSAFGFPILGDRVYGKPEPVFGDIPRQMLHAARLEFTHPKTVKKMQFEAPLPDDFQAVLKVIRS
jgi:23S rRNA pseudouridine1911/1915/1917 synthase